MKNLSKRIDELTNFDYNVLVKGACCMLKIKNLTIGDGIPKICVPMCSANEEQLIKEADEIAAKHVDIAEWRMDHYENVFDIKRVVSFAETLKKHLADTLLLCTFRTGREGGNPIAFDDNLYFDMNKALIKSRHLDMIDLELFMDKLRLKELIATAHIYGVHVIMSNHDFHRTPGKEELMTRLMTMKRMEADILKIAVMPKNEEDLLTLLEVTQQMKSRVPKQAISDDIHGQNERIIVKNQWERFFGWRSTLWENGENRAEWLRAIRKKQVNTAIHYGPSAAAHEQQYYKANVANSLQDGNYHTYSLDWDENNLTISIDNVKFHTFDISSNTYFHDNFYILFNLAVGGAFTGITDINKLTGLKDGQKVNMYIDWVKIL